VIGAKKVQMVDGLDGNAGATGEGVVVEQVLWLTPNKGIRTWMKQIVWNPRVGHDAQ
jgi:hypothetical protein